jgi:hypothetical protein
MQIACSLPSCLKNYTHFMHQYKIQGYTLLGILLSKMCQKRHHIQSNICTFILKKIALKKQNFHIREGMCEVT